MNTLLSDNHTFAIAPGTVARNSILDHCSDEQFPAGSSWQNFAEGTTATSRPSILELSLSHSALEGKPDSPGRFLHRRSWSARHKDKRAEIKKHSTESSLCMMLKDGRDSYPSST